MTGHPKTTEPVCPGTTGRESPEHNLIRVTASTYRPVPYLKCSKCGVSFEEAESQKLRRRHDD